MTQCVPNPCDHYFKLTAVNSRSCNCFLLITCSACSHNATLDSYIYWFLYGLNLELQYRPSTFYSCTSCNPCICDVKLTNIVAVVKA